jgi:uncharacterized protein (TIGR00730 family)
MRTFKRIAVFCGSSNDVDERYFELAREVGRCFGRRGLAVVYGGGNVGLMGALADAALASGVEVHGVIPEKLMDFELGHQGITELHVVADMHARKQMMASLSDAFIALPGGWGTLEEFFEATTWTQLEYHEKPVGLLNRFGYYDHLIAFLKHALDEHFIRDRYRDLISVAVDTDTLIDALATVELPRLERSVIAPERAT